MTETKVTLVRLILENDKFEILVKPDPALEYKLGKRADIAAVLVSDEIYSDANKGSRASSEKLRKHFKTTDVTDIARQILSRGELNLTTDQRRKMIEEKKKQIIQYINRSFVDPKTHIPHPPLRIESAIDKARVIIDPFKRTEDQANVVVEALRRILPLKSEVSRLSVTVPSQFSAQSYSVFKATGNLKGEQWLADGSLKVIIEMNAGMKASFIDRIGSITRGSADIKEG
ncbi:MAG TPA: ribosome assembly factor SBDS [Nitrososphaeraceae archaeon]|jgi:ribosome maturation protein SDO1|nr:ribosome assembly factor SBDS [Nitrososphaeraceae archaeon]